MSIALAIDAAIHQLSGVGRVERLSEPAASEAISSIASRFVQRPNVRWWWENLRVELPTISIRPVGGDAYLLVPAVCPSQPCWLFASDDELPPWPVYLGHPKAFSQVIAECPPFEYVIADPGLQWVLLENHHGQLIAVGEPVASSVNAYAG